MLRPLYPLRLRGSYLATPIFTKFCALDWHLQSKAWLWSHLQNNGSTKCGEKAANNLLRLTNLWLLQREIWLFPGTNKVLNSQYEPSNFWMSCLYTEIRRNPAHLSYLQKFDSCLYILNIYSEYFLLTWGRSQT